MLLVILRMVNSNQQTQKSIHFLQLCQPLSISKLVPICLETELAPLNSSPEMKVDSCVDN